MQKMLANQQRAAAKILLFFIHWNSLTVISAKGSPWKYLESFRYTNLQAITAINEGSVLYRFLMQWVGRLP